MPSLTTSSTLSPSASFAAALARNATRHEEDLIRNWTIMSVFIVFFAIVIVWFGAAFLSEIIVAICCGWRRRGNRRAHRRCTWCSGEYWDLRWAMVAIWFDEVWDWLLGRFWEFGGRRQNDEDAC